jgi:hypothetical protein
MDQVRKCKYCGKFKMSDGSFEHPTAFEAVIMIDNRDKIEIIEVICYYCESEKIESG